MIPKTKLFEVCRQFLDPFATQDHLKPKRCQISSWDDSPRATSQKKDLRAPTETKMFWIKAFQAIAESLRIVCSSDHVERIRSAGVLDSRPKGMLGFNRLLVMLEPVTALSDDEQHVPAAIPAAKGKGKGKGKGNAPKSSPKPSPPETVPSPKAKAKAKTTPKPKAKSSGSHPPMKRPSTKATPKASTSSGPKTEPPSNPSPKKGMKRPAGTSELRVSKYFYKNTKIWGFKLNGAEKFRVSHLQTFLLCSCRFFHTLHGLWGFAWGKTLSRGIGWEDRRNRCPLHGKTKSKSIQISTSNTMYLVNFRHLRKKYPILCFSQECCKQELLRTNGDVAAAGCMADP